MKKLIAGAIASLMLFSAAPFAFAQTPTPTPAPKPVALELQNRLQALLGFVDDFVIPIIFALAFIVFLWFVFIYFIAGGADEEKRGKGRQFVMWSLIGFFLMFSLWGIVKLIQNSLGFNDTDVRPTLPTFNKN